MKSDREMLEMFENWGSELEARLTIKRYLGIPKDATEREADITIEEWAFSALGLDRNQRFTPLRLLKRARFLGILPAADGEPVKDAEQGEHARRVAKVNRLWQAHSTTKGAYIRKVLGVDESDFYAWQRGKLAKSKASTGRYLDATIDRLPE